MALKLLEGMKVIEIAAFMAAPMGGRILGEWGADVIKVEPPTGDSNRGIGLARHIYNGDQAGWDSINSCKRCITLDTRKPEAGHPQRDAEGLRRVPLASATEGFQEAGSGLREPVEDQSEDHLRQHLRLRHQGRVGSPRRVRRGLLRRACRLRLGLPHQGRQPDDPVLRLRRHPHGHLSGHGRAGRYIEQQRTGKGQEVNVALMHAGMWSVGVPIVTAAYGDEYPTDPNSVLPLARPYMCSDEKAIALMGLQWHNSWPEFVHAFGMDEDLIAKWPDYQTALAASAEITPIITEVLANVTRDEAIEKLMTTDIPFDLCQHFADLQDDQQAWDAGFFQGIDYPSGKHIGIVKAPAIFSSGEAEFGPSGYPGEYTREVLKEYGFDDAKIDELREQGLVTEEDQWDKDQYNMEKLMAQAAAAKKKAE